MCCSQSNDKFGRWYSLQMRLTTFTPTGLLGRLSRRCKINNRLDNHHQPTVTMDFQRLFDMDGTDSNCPRPAIFIEDPFNCMRFEGEMRVPIVLIGIEMCLKTIESMKDYLCKYFNMEFKNY